MIDTCTIYNSVFVHSIDQNQLQLSLPSKAQKTILNFNPTQEAALGGSKLWQ
jgi:hypothetical protein